VSLLSQKEMGSKGNGVKKEMGSGLAIIYFI
jgi:hypothetical protein